jgi:hypothetical protein
MCAAPAPLGHADVNALLQQVLPADVLATFLGRSMVEIEMDLAKSPGVATRRYRQLRTAVLHVQERRGQGGSRDLTSALALHRLLFWSVLAKHASLQSSAARSDLMQDYLATLTKVNTDLSVMARHT